MFVGMMLFLFCNCNRQTSHIVDARGIERKYVNAYQHIISDKTFREWLEYSSENVDGEIDDIYVSNEIQFFDYRIFIDEIRKYKYGIKDYWSNTEHYRILSKKINDSLNSVNTNNYFEPDSIRELNQLSTSPDSRVVLYFSKVINNTLICCVYLDRFWLRKFDSVAFMNGGLYYLFSFNGDMVSEALKIEYSFP